MSETKPVLTWGEWKAELDKLLEPYYGPNAVATCGEQAWLPFYAHGFSPAQALEEDRNYWEP